MEERLPQERHGHLTVELQPHGPGEAQIRKALGQAGFSMAQTREFIRRGGERRLSFEIRQVSRAEPETPAVLSELAAMEGVIALDWRAQV